MKSLRIISTLMIALTFCISANLFAGTTTYAHPEESYINDIPFNTELIAHQLTLPEFDFADEEYVNDIPFDTECITAACMYKKATHVVFNFEEENNVNDVPFDTEKIAAALNLEQTLNVAFNLEEEEYVNDIPFNTRKIARDVSPCKYNDLYASGK